MKPRTNSQLVLATLAVLWLGGVVLSLHHRDLSWIQILLVDISWLQGLLLAVGTFGAFMVLVGTLAPAPRAITLRSPRPFVSIVVPAKNEEAVIETTVRSLWALDYREGSVPYYELIVVDDGSTDRTGELLKTLAATRPLTIVPTPPGSVGKAAALNLGIARARGELIAVFDADARVAPDFLARMVAALSGPTAGGVQSQRRLYNAEQNLLTRIQDDEYRLFSHPLQRARRVLGGMVSFSGNGLLLRRDALGEVGGWNEDALTEDIDLSLRFHLAGWDVCYCEEAVVWEEAVPWARELIRQRIRWFEGAIRCLGDHLPAILFSRVNLFKRLDMLLLLAGGLIVTLCLLTTYLYALIGAAGAVVLYLQLPRWLTTWTSAAITVGVLLAMLVELRGRMGEVGLVLIRSAVFSLHRLIVVPLAIHRYLRSAITGHTTWEKTAHGVPSPPSEHDL
jgi:1,2-diacylglycerol 3-beta-glucosyltransferase